MRLNGKSFKIYSIDSVSTIEARIAAIFYSSPRWLVFQHRPSSVAEYEKENVIVSDYLRTNVLYKDTLNLPAEPYPPGVTTAQIQDLFIGSNNLLASADDRRRQVLFYVTKNLHKDVEIIWGDRFKTIGAVNREIEDNQKAVDKFERIAADFESVSAVPFTPVEIDHTQFTIDFGPYEGSLLSLFDTLITSRFVPYASVSDGNVNLFKIHSGFKIDLDWLNLDLNNVLLLKVKADLDGAKPLQMVFKSYTNAAFIVQDSRLIATMDVNVGPRYVDKKSFITRVTDAFGDTFKIHSERGNQIVVYYTMPNQCLDSYIFSELAMNDPIFNSLIAIDEFIRPSKLLPSVYVHRLGSTTTVSMTVKQTRKQNEYGMKNIGEWYVRCRLKSEREDELGSFQKLIGKLMTYYNMKYDKILEYYKKYIPSFQPQLCSSLAIPKRTYVAKGLRAIAPEIFYPTYTRKCANPPVVVDTNYEGDTMLFPIKGETVNGTIVQPRTYGCVEQSHPFVGLRRNDLGNKTTFPFVPCCFRLDQKNKQGSLYRSYYYGERETALFRQTQETEAYKRRVLHPGETETLPENITRLFSALEPNPNIVYMRNGVTHTRLASIEAILLGRGQVSYKKMKPSLVTMKVAQEALKLDSEIYAMAAKQEFYSSTTSEIRDMIRTVDIRPSKFIRMLETAMDCNLFIFTSTSDNPKGKLVVPDHAEFYIKFEPNRETFFLYEHYGNNDTVDYPAVELITRSEGGSFLPGDSIVKKIFKLFTRMTRTYSLHTQIVTPILPRLKVSSQLIDSFGKCRVITIDDKISMITTPLPPFAAPASEKIIRAPLRVVTAFITELECRVKWQKRGEINVVLGNVECTILTTPDVILPDVIFNHSDNDFDDLDSPNITTEFGESKRTASVLLQYVLKATASLLPIDITNVDEKLDSLNIVINPKVQYKIESDRFDSNPSFYSNGIHVPSEDVRKQLLFTARIYALYRPEKLKSYVDKEIIDNYYTNVRDFIDTPAAIILKGKDAMANLTKTYDSADKKIYTSVQPQSLKPYFLKNDHFGNHVYLAVPVSSLLNANSTVVAWTDYGYYDKENVKQTNSRPEVYQVQNDQEIELISGSDGKYNGCVMAYKSSGAPPKRGRKKVGSIENVKESKYVALLLV